MNNLPWYIWFEVFENGKSRGKGMWHYPYKHKSSAIRRANQMWGKELYNPLTGTLIERIWIISQTNPWDERYIFTTRAEAEGFIQTLKLMCERYGCVLVSDAKEFADRESDLIDENYMWVLDQIKQANIISSSCGYIVDMPKALPLL